MPSFLLILLVALALSVSAAHAQDDSTTGSRDAGRPGIAGDSRPADPLAATSSAAPAQVAGPHDDGPEQTETPERQRDTLAAIRISGYVQTEWQHFDQSTSAGGRAIFHDARKNIFTVRRGRIKFQHRLGDVMSYTIQPDITEAGVTIKDAYLSLSVLRNDALRLDAGMFNRPNLEVELSSSARESVERSQIVRAFYPGERDLGLMLSSRLELAASLDPRLQLGIFNGPGTRAEIDATKDIIGRVVLPIPFGDESPVQVDVGASYYYGGIPQTGSSIVVWDGGVRDTIDNPETGGMAGFGNSRNIGVEARIDLALLPFGATVIRGEYLAGRRATAATQGTPATVGVGRTTDGRDSTVVIAGTPGSPLAVRRQNGYYLYLVQNLGTDVQLVAKYDRFDRNADLSGTRVIAAGEAASSVLGFGINVFWENLRTTVFYEIPSFASGETILIDPSTRAPIDTQRDADVKDNKTTLRLQYRF